MTEITPSPSQVDRWEMAARAATDPSLLNELILSGHFGVVHRKALCLAFAAGADQELEACFEWIESALRGQLRPANRIVEQLRAARRPKPPSLKKRIAAAITDGDERTALQLLNEALPND